MKLDIHGEAHPWDNEDASWFEPIWEMGQKYVQQKPLNFGKTSMIWPSWRCPLGDDWEYADEITRLVKANAWVHLMGFHNCGEINRFKREALKKGKSEQEAEKWARAMVEDASHSMTRLENWVQRPSSKSD